MELHRISPLYVCKHKVDWETQICYSQLIYTYIIKLLLKNYKTHSIKTLTLLNNIPVYLTKAAINDCDNINNRTMWCREPVNSAHMHTFIDINCSDWKTFNIQNVGKIYVIHVSNLIQLYKWNFFHNHSNSTLPFLCFFAQILLEFKFLLRNFSLPKIIKTYFIWYHSLKKITFCNFIMVLNFDLLHSWILIYCMYEFWRKKKPKN